MTKRVHSLDYHAAGRPGKIEVVATKPLATHSDLSLAYTSDVIEASRAIQRDPELAYQYTAKGNLVAVVTNGTWVRGCGNIGPVATKPLMEGTANVFKKFADIDAIDIELDARSVDEIVNAIKSIAPTFGGISLHDIGAPECFEVARRLQDLLAIPVLHAGRDGVAIITAAALINAAELTHRQLNEIKIVFSGAGTVALSCAELFIELGVSRSNIVMFDRHGLLHQNRGDLFPGQQALATARHYGGLGEALQDADALIGLSAPNVVAPETILNMAPRPIIFALASPEPDISYEVARRLRPDAVLATTRPEYPNQLDSVLTFPFAFRGALDCRATRFNRPMMVAAARSLAELARLDVPDKVLIAYSRSEPTFGDDYIIPKLFDPRVLACVAPAVAEAAARSGVARAPILDLNLYTQRLRPIVQRARGLMQPLLERARQMQPRRRIAFADGSSHYIQRAARILLEEGICTPLLLGNTEHIQATATRNEVSLEGMDLETVRQGPHAKQLASSLWQLRARKGMTLAAARGVLRQHAWYGAMMVREGLADGMVAGWSRAYRFTLGPAIQALGLGPGSRLVSGVHVIQFRDRQLFLGDCTVNLQPSAENLAEIAINTARAAESFGEHPRVAMLSHSDFGEHYRDARVRLVRDAVDIVRNRWPELEIDGEMQADTALVRSKIESNFPFCTLSASANVLVFPDLTSANIAYKLLTQLTDGEALGPLLLGLGGAVGIIPVGASVKDIVDIATYTAIQAPAGTSGEARPRRPGGLTSTNASIGV